jgi:hypothetical protein
LKALGLNKIRLNFWCPEANSHIHPESIHTHPGYFESFIISGGYEHELYKSADANANAIKYHNYKIIKSSFRKSFAYIGDAYLQSLGSESVQKNQIALLNTHLIHRVLHTNPNTLTINALFNTFNPCYNVFLTENADSLNVQTSRKLITNEDSLPLLHKIIELLDQYEKEGAL